MLRQNQVKITSSCISTENWTKREPQRCLDAQTQAPSWKAGNTARRPIQAVLAYRRYARINSAKSDGVALNRFATCF
jgi:hypothetical protein